MIADGLHKKHQFNFYATTYLTYALGFPNAYKVTLGSASSSVNLRGITTFNHKPIIHPNDPCQERLCYRTDEATKTGILTVRSFAYYGEQSQVFVKAIDDAFSDLSEQKRQALIIDVRGNQGGSGLAAAYLLRRIANTPFAYWREGTDARANESLFDLQIPADTRFNCPVYILIDGNTRSSVPHSAAIAKENQMATLIGTPIGGNASTNDGKRNFTSSAQGVKYAIARMQFIVAAPSLPATTPIQPDIFTPYALNDVLNGDDGMLETALQTIKTQHRK